MLEVISLITFGININKEFFFRILPVIPSMGGDIYYNQSFTSFLLRMGFVENISRIINYFILLLLTIGYLLFTKSNKQSSIKELLEYGLLIVIILISGGLAWQHHFVLLLIPYLALFIRKKLDKLDIILLILSYLLVSFNIKNPQDYSGFTSLFLSHVFYGNICLLILLIKQINKLTVYPISSKMVDI